MAVQDRSLRNCACAVGGVSRVVGGKCGGRVGEGMRDLERQEN